MRSQSEIEKRQSKYRKIRRNMRIMETKVVTVLIIGILLGASVGISELIRS